MARPCCSPAVAAGDSYAELVKLAEEGIPFALGREAEIEHYVPVRERIPA